MFAPGTERRLSPAWVAQALRRVAVCLLLLVASDLPSTARLCLLDAHGCGEACRTCFCRRDADKTRVRGACPCCRPQPAAQNPLSDVGLAVLPRPMVTTVTPPLSETFRPLALHERSFAPAVPHPPPRISTLA